MKTNKINVQLINGQAVLREIELSLDDGNIIMEALRFYQLHANEYQHDMANKGCVRLRDQAYYLKQDLTDVLDKLK